MCLACSKNSGRARGGRAWGHMSCVEEMNKAGFGKRMVQGPQRAQILGLLFSALCCLIFFFLDSMRHFHFLEVVSMGFYSLQPSESCLVKSLTLSGPEDMVRVSSGKDP